MRIGITGYGKMGVLIREKALASGHEVPAIIDPRNEAGEITARELNSTALPLDVITRLLQFKKVKAPQMQQARGFFDFELKIFCYAKK